MISSNILLDETLRAELVYFSKKGETAKSKSWMGIVPDGEYKTNISYLSLTSGETIFTPKIQIWYHVTDTESAQLEINIYNVEEHKLTHKIIIKSSNNKLNLYDFNKCVVSVIADIKLMIQTENQVCNQIIEYLREIPHPNETEKTLVINEFVA